MIIKIFREMSTNNFEEQHVNWFKFPGGEVQVNIVDSYKIIDSHVVIEHRITSGDDIIALLQLTSILKKNLVRSMVLVLPYMPFSRMDKASRDGECFSLKVFSEVINSCGFSKVHTVDSHSIVTQALINNCSSAASNYQAARFVHDILVSGDRKKKAAALIAPDLGATKRVSLVYDRLNHIGRHDLQVINCSKERDQGNGDIISLKVLGSVDGKDCFVIDDICDGGATFIEVAKNLKKNFANNLYLFVTHGIFSKGYTELLEHYTKIGCTDSYKTNYPDFIEVFPHGL